MAEGMNPEQVKFQERLNSGSSWTRNEQFDKDGYLVVKNLWDVEELYRPVPEMRGQINYWGKKPDQFNFTPLEGQVEGSLAVYTHPQYRHIHSGIRLKLEQVIGRQLFLKNVGHFGLRHPIPMVTIREKFLKKVKIVLCVFNQVMV